MSDYQKGFSVIEVLLSGALLAIYSTVFTGALLYSEESSRDSLNRLSATARATEAIEVVRDMRMANFSNLVDGIYGITTSPEGYVLHSPPDTTENLVRSVAIESPDVSTKKVTASVSWQERGHITRAVSLITYFYDWVRTGILAFVDSTYSEFSLGKQHSVYIDEQDGSVILEREGDWKSAFTFFTHDLSGTASIKAIASDDTELFVGRDESVLSPELALFDMAHLSGGELIPVASYDIGYSIRDMAVAPRTLFLATNTQNEDLVLFDRLSASTTAVDIPGAAGALSIAYHNGYVAVGKPSQPEGELFIYDEFGELLGSVEVGDSVDAIALTDEYAYLATSNINELWIVDYKDCPLEVCTVVRKYNPSDANNPNAKSIAVEGELVFIGMDTNRVVGLSFAGPITTTSTVNELFSTDYGSSNISSLSYDTLYNRLFITQESSYGAEVRTISVKDYTTETIDVSGSYAIHSALKTGRFLITAGGQGILNVVSAGRGGWTKPILVKKEDMVGADNALSVNIFGSLAYITRSDAGASMDFAIYEVTNPEAPVFLDGVNLSASIYDVVVVGDFAYLATSHNSEEVMVLYVKDPTNIVKVGYYNLDSGSDARAISAIGTTVFVGTMQNTSSGSHYEVHILVPNTTNSALVTFAQIGGYEVNEDVLGMDTQDSTLFLATDNNTKELIILDASNPTDLLSLSSVDIAGTLSATSVAVTGNGAYVGTNHSTSEGDIHIIDTTSLTSPIYRGAIDIGEDVTGVSAVFPHLFLSTNNNASGFIALTTASSTHPKIESIYNTAGDCNGITTNQSKVYVACENNASELFIFTSSELDELYSHEGWYTSRIYNTNKEDVSVTGIQWESIQTASTSIELMVRYAKSTDPATMSAWYGPQGAGSYYSVGDGLETIPQSLVDIAQMPLLQYRFRLVTEDASTTPKVESTSIFYE